MKPKITDSNEKKRLYTEFSYYTATLDKTRTPKFCKNFSKWELFTTKSKKLNLTTINSIL